MTKEQSEWLLRLIPDPNGYVSDKFRNTSNILEPDNLNRVKSDVESFVELLPKNISPLEKTSLLYETLRRSIKYDYSESETKYSYVAALYKGEAVCMGIAELFHIMALRYGIENRIVIGRGSKSLHAWNMVRLPDKSTGEEKWVHLDLCWDLLEHKLPIPCCYFLKSDSYMREHEHDWLSSEYPECPASIDVPKDLIKKEGIELACQVLKQVLQESRS